MLYRCDIGENHSCPHMELINERILFGFLVISLIANRVNYFKDEIVTFVVLTRHLMCQGSLGVKKTLSK
jgi:hypothetical protein